MQKASIKIPGSSLHYVSSIHTNYQAVSCICQIEAHLSKYEFRDHLVFEGSASLVNNPIRTVKREMLTPFVVHIKSNLKRNC